MPWFSCSPSNTTDIAPAGPCNLQFSGSGPSQGYHRCTNTLPDRISLVREAHIQKRRNRSLFLRAAGNFCRLPDFRRTSTPPGFPVSTSPFASDTCRRSERNAVGHHCRCLPRAPTRISPLLPPRRTDNRRRPSNTPPDPCPSRLRPRNNEPRHADATQNARRPHFPTSSPRSSSRPPSHWDCDSLSDTWSPSWVL